MSSGSPGPSYPAALANDYAIGNQGPWERITSIETSLIFQLEPRPHDSSAGQLHATASRCESNPSPPAIFALGQVAVNSNLKLGPPAKASRVGSPFQPSYVLWIIPKLRRT